MAMMQRLRLERRDVDLESARDEARRLERERDLAERERDLEHQLHKIRTEMAAGGALGTAAARAAADDAFSGERRDALKLGGRSFVGTDVTFADNWLRPAVGIEDGTGDLAAQVIAGSSTALGFLAVQSAQNLTLPKGKNWIDPQ